MYWRYFLFSIAVYWILIYTPVRVSFEEKLEVRLQDVVIDSVVDVFFLADFILTIFFIPLLTSEGNYIFDKKTILKHHLLAPLTIIRLASFVPASVLKYTGKEGGQDDMENFFNGNFKSLPRFYKLLLIAKLIRIEMVRKILKRFLKRTRFQMDIQDLIMTFINMLILLHLIANFWSTASTFSLSTNENWIV